MTDLSSLAMGSGQQAHDDIKDVGGSLLQWQHDKQMQRRSVRGSAYLNSQMAMLSRDARQMSASDQVAGLRAAGLNPVLAQGGSFGSVSSGGTAPAPSTSATPAPRGSMGKLALESIRYAESERDLMEAQTANLRAEARSKQLDNANKEGVNQVSATLLRDQLNHIKSSSSPTSSSYAWADSMLRISEYNAGTLEAFGKAMDYMPKVDEANYKSVANRLAEMYSNIKLTNLQSPDDLGKRTRDALAQVDYEEARQIRETTDNIVANTLLLTSEMLKNDKNMELIDKQKELIDKQMQQIDQLIKSTHHKDLIDMWENGEYLNTFLSLGFQSAPQIVGGLATGGGLAGINYLLRRSPSPKPVKGLQRLGDF